LKSMLGNQDWKSSFAMLSNAEQYLAIFYYIYGSLLRRDRQILRSAETFFLYLAYNQFFS
jgi:hypothetical protein